MKTVFTFEPEPFASELVTTGLDTGMEVETAFGLAQSAEIAGLDDLPELEEEEIRRGSPLYNAGVQHALNQILGLQLAVDGQVGSATLGAIRRFQQENGLAVDGKVGPQTEQRLVLILRNRIYADPKTICASIRHPEVLGRFDFDSDRIKPLHQPQLSNIAQCVIASQRLSQPIRSIRIVGHTDPVGSSAYNLDLGRRRAQQVRQALEDNINLLQPGLAASISFTVETRGESEPTTGDRASQRRVVVFLPAPVTPKGCPPFKARIRVHVKILQQPNIPVATMINSMRQVYGPEGFLVELASTENLNLPDLVDLDVGPCTVGTVTPEQQQLFAHRNGAGSQDVVTYFVRSTVPPYNGCAAHPSGRPGAVIAQGATQWTMGHEIGHVLGLSHVNNNDRLMTGNGTANITNPPPDLVPVEIQVMDASNLTINC